MPRLIRVASCSSAPLFEPPSTNKTPATPVPHWKNSPPTRTRSSPASTWRTPVAPRQIDRNCCACSRMPARVTCCWSNPSNASPAYPLTTGVRPSRDRLHGPAHRRARPAYHQPRNAGYQGRRVHRPDAWGDQLNAGGNDGRYCPQGLRTAPRSTGTSIEKARAAGKYQGRPVDTDLHKRINELLGAGLGIRATARHTNCSITTVLQVR